MYSTIALATILLGVFIELAGAQVDVQSDPKGLKLDSKSDTQTYLSIAIEEQQVAIVLGQLATQRAHNERVKEYGSKVARDHTAVRREAEQLASAHQVPLPKKLTPEDIQKVDELSQLSGHEFDRAYMNFTLQNHEATLEQYEQHIKTMRYPDLREYFTSTVPIVQAHRDQARSIKNSLQTNP
jgi:putative membrane protein